MERGTTLFSNEGAPWPQLGDHSESPPGLSLDVRLVQECLAGSQDAWSALIDKYRNLIYAIPIRQGLAGEAAGEIFQEVCLKLVTELPQLRDVRSLAAWLIRITTHQCFHWLGQHSRMPFPNPGLWGQEKEGLAGSAETMFVEIEREQILRDAVSCLGGRCRQLIRMLFFTAPRPSYEQIATELAIAKGSIGFIRMRCLQRLRRDLEERGYR